MSNLVDHARLELELIGEEPAVIENIVKIVEVFASMGPSGGLVSVAIPMINRLLSYKNLAPLTDDPSEWVYHDEKTWGSPGGIWQNKRNSAAFSDDQGKTYILIEDTVSEDGSHPFYKTSTREELSRNDDSPGSSGRPGQRHRSNPDDEPAGCHDPDPAAGERLPSGTAAGDPEPGD